MSLYILKVFGFHLVCQLVYDCRVDVGCRALGISASRAWVLQLSYLLVLGKQTKNLYNTTSVTNIIETEDLDKAKYN
jgi:hypothetical protein